MLSMKDLGCSFGFSASIVDRYLNNSEKTGNSKLPFSCDKILSKVEKLYSTVTAYILNL